MRQMPFTDLRLEQAYLYWHDKAAGRPMPSRADIEPGELRSLLPHILLFDVIEGGKGFRYRLVGTEVERHIGQAVTGRLIDEVLSGDYLAHIRSLHLQAIAATAPVYSESKFAERRGGFTMMPDFKRAYRLVLPLSRDGSAVDMVLWGQLLEPIRNRHEPDVLLVDRSRTPDRDS